MTAASLLFACMGACVKAAADRHAVGELVFWRGIVSVVVIGAWVLLTGRSLATAHWRWHVFRDIAGVAALLAYFHAVARIPLATAITLNYTSPLFLALIIGLSLRQWPSRMLWAALLVGFAGVALVLQPTLDADAWPGALMALGAGALASFAYLGVRRLGRAGEPEWRVVFHFSLLATVLGAVVMVGGETTAIQWVSGADGMLLLGVGLFGLAAQLCMTAAYKRGRALGTAALSNLTIVFASALGVLFWDEHLVPTAWAGIALVVGACIAATWGMAARGDRSVSADV